MPTPADLERRLSDGRSRRVVFVSHCLLNENVRYLGGACRPGSVEERVAAWQRAGLGICQMPCPEQRAWGGVLKRAIVPAFGSSRSPLWPFRSVVLAAFVAYTKLRYSLLARRVAADIADYRRSGFQVEAVFGVDGSPSCGVTTRIDVRSWLETVGRWQPDDIDAARVNECVIASAQPGPGWFIAALARRLRGSATRFEAHDLLQEISARPQ